jgi:hypothetical protein
MGHPMQNQQAGQNQQQWFSKPPVQQNQQIIINQRSMQMGQNFPGPSGQFMARPRQQMGGKF